MAIPLNKENGLLERSSDDYAVHPGVLQQPGFRYQPAGMKKKLVDDYIALKKDQAKLRDAMDLLNKGSNDYETFSKLTADTETIH